MSEPATTTVIALPPWVIVALHSLHERLLRGIMILPTEAERDAMTWAHHVFEEAIKED